MKFHDIYDEQSIEAINNLIQARIIKDDNDCWHWNGYYNKGYPMVSPYISKDDDKKKIGVSVKKFLYLQTHQDQDEELISHKKIRNICCRKHCVNPAHFKIENKSKFNEKKALKILSFYRNNIMRLHTKGAVAEALGISNATITNYLKIYLNNPSYWDNLINQQYGDNKFKSEELENTHIEIHDKEEYKDEQEYEYDDENEEEEYKEEHKEKTLEQEKKECKNEETGEYRNNEYKENNEIEELKNHNINFSEEKIHEENKIINKKKDYNTMEKPNKKDHNIMTLLKILHIKENYTNDIDQMTYNNAKLREIIFNLKDNLLKKTKKPNKFINLIKKYIFKKYQNKEIEYIINKLDEMLSISYQTLRKIYDLKDINLYIHKLDKVETKYIMQQYISEDFKLLINIKNNNIRALEAVSKQLEMEKVEKDQKINELEKKLEQAQSFIENHMQNLNSWLNKEE